MASVSGYFSVEEKVERGRREGGWEGLRMLPGLQWGHCGPQDGDALSGVGPAGITGDGGGAPSPSQMGCAPGCGGSAPRAAPGPGEDRVVVGSGQVEGWGCRVMLGSPRCHSQLCQPGWGAGLGGGEIVGRWRPGPPFALKSQQGFAHEEA